MIGTLVGLALGAVVAALSKESEGAVNLNGIGGLLVALPAGIFLLYLAIYGWMVAPLQKAEQNTTPRILEMFKKDPFLGFNHLGLVGLPFIALILGIDANTAHLLPQGYLLGIWVLLFGASLDLMVQFMRRILSYLNPFMVAQLFRQAANRSIQNDKEADLCEWVDALSEMGGRALDKGGISLCNETLHELHEITRVFLEASKSIGHVSQDDQSKSLGINDKVSYTLFYLFQRLEMLFHKALERRLEPVCSTVLTIFGKVAVEAAKYDISLASFPLQYIGKLSLQAHQQRLQDIGLKTTCLYLELGKALLTDIDITYMELQEPFFTIIHHMDELAKEAFKQNKEIPIKALVQPFYDLRGDFAEGKAASHQDTPTIVADIDRVIAEFDTLEAVLRTIPPIPSLVPEAAPSEQKDEFKEGSKEKKGG